MARDIEHRWAVDGIEEGVARIEEDGERMLSVPIHLLPPGTQEGQVLRVTRTPGAGGAQQLSIVVDEKETDRALKRSQAATAEALAESKRRDPGGNVSL
jgi:hypothetical protein